ncbi:LysR family transcriptional regulator substrate-binding protein, partial [Escherichia coli]|nr:LysR family transcriptional regulator substrate-binding protein [Escherichia coli]
SDRTGRLPELWPTSKRARSAQKTEPAIDVRFVEGNGDDIADQVARGTINVAFIQERVNKASIVSEHCWNETIVVALPEGHRL